MKNHFEDYLFPTSYFIVLVILKVKKTCYSYMCMYYRIYRKNLKLQVLVYGLYECM